jgi:aryl-phospho-beta-D-glucosidase BglC (GH1 family)
MIFSLGKNSEFFVKYIFLAIFSLAFFPSSGLAITETALTCNEISTFSGYRGINISFHTNPKIHDLEKISLWGANVVRLVIHADPAMPQYRDFFDKGLLTINEAAFKKVDEVIEFAAKNKLKIIIDLHTAPGVKSGNLWTDFKYWEALEKLWAFFADRYKNNPTVVGYDLLNEPNLVTSDLSPIERLSLQQGHWRVPNDWRGTPRDYFALMTRIARIVNRISPAKIIIVEGVGLWGNPINFNWMEPIDACNVVYSFHMYVPHKFTHSGSGNNSRNIAYDSNKQRQSIVASIEPVARFAKKFNVPIFVGEFGLNYYNEGRGASEWLDDVLGIFESNGWSWTYWTYSIDFRNPEILIEGNKFTRNLNTERLDTLRKFWKKNKVPLPANLQ